MADFKGGKLLAVIGDEVRKLLTLLASDLCEIRPFMGTLAVVVGSLDVTAFLLQDTCTGFLLGGVGEMNAKRQPNFLVVNKGIYHTLPYTEVHSSRLCRLLNTVWSVVVALHLVELCSMDDEQME